MCYEERVIKGLVCYRTAPIDEWRPVVTGWFPLGVNPVHNGRYECETCGYYHPRYYHLWENGAWFTDTPSKVPLSPFFRWRGLAEKPQ